MQWFYCSIERLTSFIFSAVNLLSNESRSSICDSCSEKFSPFGSSMHTSIVPCRRFICSVSWCVSSSEWPDTIEAFVLRKLCFESQMFFGSQMFISL